jgi:alpha-amylase
MSRQISLVFGCHSHQPVGNFDHVFEQAYDQAYLPFIEVLEGFPGVHVTLHYTGPLLDWFEAHRPEFLDRLGTLVQAGQVEIMGGAYYEPLLSAIPERDSVRQIERMNAWCESHFGERPQGMWLAERVWEPHMPKILREAGIDYTALDDTHFLCSGVAREDLFGYYITEHEGFPVKVFPILKPLRYMIPFHPVQETLDYLWENATEEGQRCAVIHDDGEKFGIWPGTYGSVYEEGWLRNFFQALTDNKDWIHCLTYKEYMAKAGPIGRTYLPTASYREMMEWALPTDVQHRLHDIMTELESQPDRFAAYERFIRGGFWRNFLAKYSEANSMQKKMLRVSAKLHHLADTTAKNPALTEAERLLHQGQCNCAYWHGVFGGLYLNHLRTAIYENLIAAERVLDTLEHPGMDWVRCEKTDFDADGFDEAILENSELSLIFSAQDGGTLFELDYKKRPFNLLNTLSRREEPYHRYLREQQPSPDAGDGGSKSIHEMVRVKEAGLDQYLVYDPYRRVSLRDHFMPVDTNVEQLWTVTQQEFGDFATAPYQLETREGGVVFSHRSELPLDGGVPIEVRKEVTVEPRASEVRILYDIRCAGGAGTEVLFGVEFSANFLSGTAFDRYYRSDDVDLNYAKLGERGTDEGLSHIAMCDNWLKLEFGLRLDQAARVYRFAIETVSQSEGGQERVYQGSVVVPCWRVVLQPGQQVRRGITMYINQI